MKRKFYGIPIAIMAAVLAVVLIAGSAFASSQVWTYTFQTTVAEPITVEVTEELTNQMYPGLGTNSEYIITNTGPVGLSVTATWPGQETGSVKCYATIRYLNADGTSGADIVRVDYDGTETFNLSAGESAKVQLGVLVGADAEPGVYDFVVEVSRG